MLAAGVAGQVTAAQFDGTHLPYADNLVNLVVDSTGGKVPQAEIMRILAPGGVYMVGGKRMVKPWPTDIDQWTHYLHGPDNNAVARDETRGRAAVDPVGLRAADSDAAMSSSRA